MTRSISSWKDHRFHICLSPSLDLPPEHPRLIHTGISPHHNKQQQQQPPNQTLYNLSSTTRLHISSLAHRGTPIITRTSQTTISNSCCISHGFGITTALAPAFRLFWALSHSWDHLVADYTNMDHHTQHSGVDLLLCILGYPTLFLLLDLGMALVKGYARWMHGKQDCVPLSRWREQRGSGRDGHSDF